jgi:hypothetical protein
MINTIKKQAFPLQLSLQKTGACKDLGGEERRDFFEEERANRAQGELARLKHRSQDRSINIGGADRALEDR